jgi:hypothetical protein
MDSLTHENTLLSLSRSPVFELHDSRTAIPTGEKPLRNLNDNLDAIWEVDYLAYDSALAPSRCAWFL